MLKNFIIPSVAVGLVIATLSGCSGASNQNNEIQDADVFGQAPAVVSDDVDLLGAPSTNYQVATSAPLVPAIPVQPEAQAAPQTYAYSQPAAKHSATQPQGLDCSVLPTSKEGLAIYRELCL